MFRHNRLGEIQRFLAEYCPAWLSAEEAEAIADPLTQREIASAMSTMQAGKSPDPDGSTLQYYKSLLPRLQDPFLKAFETPYKLPLQTPTSILEAHIVVIPKGNKGQTQVSKYHPNLTPKCGCKNLHESPTLPSVYLPTQIDTYRPSGFRPGLRSWG